MCLNRTILDLWQKTLFKFTGFINLFMSGQNIKRHELPFTVYVANTNKSHFGEFRSCSLSFLKILLFLVNCKLESRFKLTFPFVLSRDMWSREKIQSLADTNPVVFYQTNLDLAHNFNSVSCMNIYWEARFLGCLIFKPFRMVKILKQSGLPRT